MAATRFASVLQDILKYRLEDVPKLVRELENLTLSLKQPSWLKEFSEEDDETRAMIVRWSVQSYSYALMSAKLVRALDRAVRSLPRSYISCFTMELAVLLQQLLRSTSLADLRKLSAFLEQNVARELISQNHFDPISRLLQTALETACQHQHGTQHAQDVQYQRCSIKLCVQVLRLFSPNIKSEFSACPGHLSMGGQRKVCSQQTWARIVAALLISLVQGQDLDLLAGTALAMIFNLAPSQDMTQTACHSVLSVLSCGLTCVTFAGMQFDIVEMGLDIPHDVSVPTAAFVKGVLVSCDRETLRGGHTPVLVQVFPFILHLCQEPKTHDYLAFHLLAVWYQKVEDVGLTDASSRLLTASLAIPKEMNSQQILFDIAPVQDTRSASDTKDLLLQEAPVQDTRSASDTKDLLLQEAPVQDPRSASDTKDLLLQEAPVQDTRSASDTKDLLLQEAPVQDTRSASDTKDLPHQEAPVQDTRSASHTEDLLLQEAPVQDTRSASNTEDLLLQEAPVQDTRSASGSKNSLSSHTSFMSRGCQILTSTLICIWPNWESPVEGVSDLVGEIFDRLLTIWKQAVTEGISDYVDLSQQLTSRALDLAWHSKARYKQLRVLLKHVDCVKDMQKDRELRTDLMRCMKANQLAAVSCDVYRTCVQRIINYHNQTKALQIWTNVWMPTLLVGLTSTDSLQALKTRMYWLPPSLKLVTGSYERLLNVTEQHLSSCDHPSRLRWLFAWVAVSAVGREVLHISNCCLASNLLQESLLCAEDGVRVEALQLVCTSLRRGEPMSNVESDLLLQFLPANLKSDSVSFRQNMTSALRKMFVRIRDSCITAIRNNRTEETFLVRSLQFVEWLYQLLMDSMVPGGCYQRRQTSLDLLAAVLETLVYLPDNTGKALESAEILWLYAQRQGMWQFFTQDSFMTLLCGLEDGVLEIQSQCYQLLIKYFMCDTTSSLADGRTRVGSRSSSDSRTRVGSRSSSDSRTRVGSRSSSDNRTRVGSRSSSDSGTRVGSRSSSDSRTRVGSRSLSDSRTRVGSRSSSDSRTRVGSRSSSDSTSRTRVGSRSSSDSTSRTRVGSRSSSDSTSRTRVGPRSSPDNTSRTRVGPRSSPDSTSRTRVGPRSSPDNTSRTRVGPRSSPDSTSRTRVGPRSSPDSVSGQILHRALCLISSPRAYENHSGLSMLSLVLNMYILGPGCKSSSGELNMTMLNRGQLREQRVPVTSCTVVHEEAASAVLDLLMNKWKISFDAVVEDVGASFQIHSLHGLTQSVTRCHLEIARSVRRGTGSLHFEDWKRRLQEIVSLNQKIINLVLEVLAGEQSCETCPSFADMGRALKSLISTDQDQDQDMMCVSPQFAMLLSWCWLNIKESCSCLGEVTTLAVTEDGSCLLPLSMLSTIGQTFMSVLTTCRHRGAIEGSRRGLSHFCLSLMSSGIDSLEEIPCTMLQQILSSLSQNCLISSVTRRSAGLPIIIQTVIQAAHRSKTRSLLMPTVEQLYDVACQQLPADFSQLQDLSQSHALHILRTIVCDASLAPQLLPLMSKMVVLVVEGFDSPSWGVRNAATQLISTLVTRLFGQRNSDEASSSLEDFSSQYPQLVQFLCDKMRIYITSKVTVRPSLYVVLTLLSQLGMSSSHQHTSSCRAFLRESLLFFISSPVFSLRKLSAQAYVALSPLDRADTTLEHILHKIIQRKLKMNELHGWLIGAVCLISSGAVSSDMCKAALTFLVENQWLIWKHRECLLPVTALMQVVQMALRQSEPDTDLLEPLWQLVEAYIQSTSTFQVVLQVDREKCLQQCVQVLTAIVRSSVTGAVFKPRLCQFLYTNIPSPHGHLREAIVDCLQAGTDDVLADPSIQRALLAGMARETDLTRLLQTLDVLTQLALRGDLHLQSCDFVSLDLSAISSQWGSLHKFEMVTFLMETLLIGSSSSLQLDNRYMTVQKWCDRLVTYTKPTHNEDRRLDAARSLAIAGGNVLGFCHVHQTLPGIDVLVNSLIRASLQLLDDPEPDVRQLVAGFVGRTQGVASLTSGWSYPALSSLICQEFHWSSNVVSMLLEVLYTPSQLTRAVRAAVSTRDQVLFEPETTSAMSESFITQIWAYNTLQWILAADNGCSPVFQQIKSTVGCATNELHSNMPAITDNLADVFNISYDHGVVSSLFGMMRLSCLLMSSPGKLAPLLSGQVCLQELIQSLLKMSWLHPFLRRIQLNDLTEASVTRLVHKRLPLLI